MVGDPMNRSHRIRRPAHAVKRNALVSELGIKVKAKIREAVFGPGVK